MNIINEHDANFVNIFLLLFCFNFCLSTICFHIYYTSKIYWNKSFKHKFKKSERRFGRLSYYIVFIIINQNLNLSFYVVFLLVLLFIYLFNKLIPIDSPNFLGVFKRLITISIRMHHFLNILNLCSLIGMLFFLFFSFLFKDLFIFIFIKIFLYFLFSWFFSFLIIKWF